MSCGSRVEWRALSPRVDNVTVAMGLAGEARKPYPAQLPPQE